MPPIEGTFSFCTPNGSILASRCTSLTLCRFIHRIKYWPNQADTINASIKASRERNEM
ncbi:unknown [Prevotella sp. CAG:755]|nr:unknown [Prevotella sp. CAG:755]